MLVYNWRISGLAAAAVAIVFSFTSTVAHAQQNSLFGASSPLSGNNGFQVGSNSVSGQTAGGGLSLPSSTLPSNTLPGQTGATGAAGANGQQTGFVGMQSTRMAGISQTTTNPAGLNQTSRQGQNRNRGTQRNNQNGQTGTANNQQTRTIRPQLKVNFDYPTPSTAVTTAAIATRFDKLSSRAEFSGITVESDGGTIILRGSVDSNETRRLAASIARLQPGVKSIKNELSIAEEPAPTPTVQ